MYAYVQRSQETLFLGILQGDISELLIVYSVVNAFSGSEDGLYPVDIC